MRFVTFKDKTCTVKEGVNPQMIFDLRHEPLEQADALEEEADPLGEEDMDHQAHQEDHQMDCREETITVTGMIWKETKKAVT